MQKALISHLEPAGQGHRIAQVSAQDFPVCEPLHWVDVAAGVSAETHMWNPQTQKAELLPAPLPVTP